MNGLILSNCGSACSCGGKFKTFHCKITKLSYPLCDKCQSTPKKLRIKKNMPDSEGKVEAVYFYSYNGKPLTEISDCVELIGNLNQDIHSPGFKIANYSAKHRKALKFSSVADAFIEHANKRNQLPDTHDEYLGPKWHKERLRYVKDHLKPYFGEEPIDQIDKHKVHTFFLSYKEKDRTRNLATGELKALLNFAKDDLDLIDRVPAFPPLKRAKQIKANQIPVAVIQAKVIQNIKSQKYRDFWTLTAALAKRDCESRAWKVRDYVTRHSIVEGGSFETKKCLVTERHLSYGVNGEVLIGGRKSINSNEELGIVEDYLDDFLIEIIERNIQNKGPEDFIFSGDLVPKMCASTATKQWNKSCRELKLKIRPYVGTKHATLTDILRRTGSMAKVVSLSRHTNEETAKIYAKLNVEDMSEIVDTSRFKMVFNRCVENSTDQQPIEINHETQAV